MKLWNKKPAAYTTILTRLEMVEADPSLGEGRWSREEEITNDLFKLFKISGRAVTADAIDAVFTKAKADPTFGQGGLDRTEELANELTKLWRTAGAPLLLTKAQEATKKEQAT